MVLRVAWEPEQKMVSSSKQVTNKLWKHSPFVACGLPVSLLEEPYLRTLDQEWSVDLG